MNEPGRRDWFVYQPQISFRTGIVAVQDPAKCLVRVKFPDHGDLLSWWLPILVTKSQNDKWYWIPDIGEQVVCLMDEHDENGCVLGAIYSTVDIPPVNSADKWHVTFKDGTTIEYDRALHKLDIECVGTVYINAATQIVLAGGGPQVARIGDQTICPAGVGHIVSGSQKVQSG